jgi:GT2 family glycosyltransferase
MEITHTILISLLTYKSTDVIEKCLKSLQNQSNQNFKCFVFDNNSQDNLEEIIKKYPWVTLINTKENNGYTGGHNFAFSYFKKNYPKYKYMMILNPDIYLPKNLIQGFFNLFKVKETILYTCPILYDFNGKKRLRSSTNISLPSFTFFGKDLTKKEVKQKYIKTMFVSGSCFVVNLQKYKYNFLFKDYFMYHDEIELSLRVILDGNENLNTTIENHIHYPKKHEVSEKVNYLLEVNRLKLQVDVFNHLFVLLNLPFYLVNRFLIILIFKPVKHYLICFKGLKDGLIYFYQNAFKLKVISFEKTVKFLFIENQKYK